MREMEILAANGGDNISAAAAAAAAAAAVTGAADPAKHAVVSAGSTPVTPASAIIAPNLAMIHPAFR